MGKHCCTVWQETTLNNMMRVKTDILNCNSGPGSIQCTRTSFLASFASSCPASKKNISVFLIGVSDTVFLKNYVIETCQALFMCESVDKKQWKILTLSLQKVVSVT